MRDVLQVLLATLAILGAPCAPAVAAPQTAASIQVEEVDGDLVCTVRARQVPVELVVRELAREAGYEVTGFEDIADLERVTVHLLQRPFSPVVHTVLGAAGLRAKVLSNRIEVAVETSWRPTSRELEDLAEVTLLRTLRHYPDHPRSAEMEFSLAGIQESRGHLGAARGTYDYLVERHPGSDLVPLATLRSGLVLEELGEWSDAATRFTALGNTEQPHEYDAIARLELARCSAELGRNKQALWMLDALDRRYPVESAREERDRLLVRARASNGADQPHEALRCLDRIEALDGEARPPVEAMEERGRALELTGRASEASAAWLAFAAGLEGDRQAAALAEAARLALAAGDEIGATFLARHAAQLGHGQALAGHAAEARARLGLAPDQLANVTPRIRFDQASGLLQKGAAHQARGLLEQLFRHRDELDADFALEVVHTYARSAELDGDLEDAIRILRESVAESTDEGARLRTYLLGAQLYEKHGRHEEAADAYGGRL